MAKKFLDGAQIGPMSQKMRGKGVAQRVRRDMRRKAEFKAQRLNQPLRGTCAKSVAATADKQG